jgi:hypothetical protein
MTNQQLIDYYADLLVLQYRQKPNAYAMIQTLVKPVIMDQLAIQVQDAFNIETAIGVQLDVLGKYTGVTRTGNGFSGPITLGDDDFRQLIKLAILTNNSSSSLATIQSLIHLFFDGKILVFDYQNMHMNYLINANALSLELVELFITEGLLPKPMGVQLAATIYTPYIDTLFGFGSYEAPAVNNSPFNTYEDYILTYPWLKYQDALF